MGIWIYIIIGFVGLYVWMVISGRRIIKKEKQERQEFRMEDHSPETIIDLIKTKTYLFTDCHGDYYRGLINALTNKEWDESDRLTWLLVYLGNGGSVDDYSKHISDFGLRGYSPKDWKILDILWNHCSERKYGFSVQGALLEELSGKEKDFIKKVQWDDKSINNSSAPKGHYPKSFYYEKVFDRAEQKITYYESQEKDRGQDWYESRLTYIPEQPPEGFKRQADGRWAKEESICFYYPLGGLAIILEMIAKN